MRAGTRTTHFSPHFIFINTINVIKTMILFRCCHIWLPQEKCDGSFLVFLFTRHVISPLIFRRTSFSQRMIFRWIYCRNFSKIFSCSNAVVKLICVKNAWSSVFSSNVHTYLLYAFNYYCEVCKVCVYTTGLSINLLSCALISTKYKRESKKSIDASSLMKCWRRWGIPYRPLRATNQIQIHTRLRILFVFLCA